jgi:Family of unknown function (DUF6459)
MSELPALRPVNGRPVNGRLVKVRLVKVPDAAPPYDCQVHGGHCPAPGGQIVAEPATGTADAAPGGRAPPAGLALPAGGPRPVVPSAVAAPAVAAAVDLTAAWPRRLAIVIVEVLAGVRPDRQLVVLATDRVRARVAGLAPLLACDQRPRITRIVTSRPAARVVEMTVVVNFGPRSRALALRVEHVAARPAAPGWPARPARWLCTAIEAG